MGVTMQEVKRPPLLTKPDAMEYIGLSRYMIDLLVAEGRLPVIRVGSRELFRVVDLDAFLEGDK